MQQTPTRNWRQMLTLAELTCIVLAAVILNWRMVAAPAHERLYGHEAEWLTSTVHQAHLSLRDYGYLPLWNPYNDFGEPLVDNPFSFVLNPISAVPSLLFGANMGVRISVVLYAIFAGMGGWFLARILNLGLLGRLLLALLMIAKGNMVAMTGMGFFQLGTAQAYFPWIIGAGIAVLRIPGARWHVVLLAILFALLFWAGNIWYTLPIIVALLVLTLFHIAPGKRGTWDFAALRRMLLAGVLAIGLSAVTLLPIFTYRDFIGKHSPEAEAGDVVDPFVVASLFVSDGQALFRQVEEPYYAQFYYSYVIPLWFLALVLLLLPPIALFRPFRRQSVPDGWRIVLPVVILMIGAFIWGVGGNPLMIWLYDVVPGLARWRFVGRALALTSFWLVLLLALRIDSVWKLVFDPAWQESGLPVRSVRALQINIGVILLAIAAAAIVPVYTSARFYSLTAPSDPHDNACLTWLRLQYPTQELAAWRFGYEVTTPFLDNRIRQVDIEADYAALPIAWTIGQIDLTQSPAEFGIGWYGEEGESLEERGYLPMADSLRSEGRSCMYRLPGALPYAFAIPLETVRTATGSRLDAGLTTPLPNVQRMPDRIRLYAPADPAREMVVTIQERAYPGWQVQVDGAFAQLESVGGQVGVVLPPGGDIHEITFAYRPPLFFIGGGITLFTALVCAGYLLRWDRLRRNRVQGAADAPLGVPTDHMIVGMPNGASER